MPSDKTKRKEKKKDKKKKIVQKGININVNINNAPKKGRTQKKKVVTTQIKKKDDGNISNYNNTWNPAFMAGLSLSKKKDVRDDDEIKKNIDKLEKVKNELSLVKNTSLRNNYGYGEIIPYKPNPSLKEMKTVETNTEIDEDGMITTELIGLGFQTLNIIDKETKNYYLYDGFAIPKKFNGYTIKYIGNTDKKKKGDGKLIKVLAVPEPGKKIDKHFKTELADNMALIYFKKDDLQVDKIINEDNKEKKIMLYPTRKNKTYIKEYEEEEEEEPSDLSDNDIPDITGTGKTIIRKYPEGLINRLVDVEKTRLNPEGVGSSSGLQPERSGTLSTMFEEVDKVMDEADKAMGEHRRLSANLDQLLKPKGKSIQ